MLKALPGHTDCIWYATCYGSIHDEHPWTRRFLPVLLLHHCDFPHYLSLIVHSQLPVDDIFLDGESLEDLPWRSDGVFSFIHMTISEGFHQVWASSSRFSAYVYSHTGELVGGSGYAVRSHYGRHYYTQYIEFWHFIFKPVLTKTLSMLAPYVIRILLSCCISNGNGTNTIGYTFYGIQNLPLFDFQKMMKRKTKTTSCLTSRSDTMALRWQRMENHFLLCVLQRTPHQWEFRPRTWPWRWMGW